MIVHSCVVKDGRNQTVEILDSEGCAEDKFILNNLEYSNDLMAGQEAHVYSFADRSQLFFQCQVRNTQFNGQKSLKIQFLLRKLSDLPIGNAKTIFLHLPYLKKNAFLLNFSIKITIIIKEPRNECPRPKCNPLLRSRREIRSFGIIDVLQSLEIFNTFRETFHQKRNNKGLSSFICLNPLSMSPLKNLIS